MLNLCRETRLASCFCSHCHSNITPKRAIIICRGLVTDSWEADIYQFISQNTQRTPDTLVWAGKLEGQWQTGSGSSINWDLNLQTCSISEKGRTGQSSLFAEFNCSLIEVTGEFRLAFEELKRADWGTAYLEIISFSVTFHTTWLAQKSCPVCNSNTLTFLKSLGVF